MSQHNGNSNGSKSKFANFVVLTLQAASDGEARFSASGNKWASARAFLSQGKDEASGNFKPSLWFTLKGFTSKQGDTTVPDAMEAIAKGEKVTVKGRIGLEEWTGSDGNTRQAMIIFVSHVEPFANGESGDAGDLGDEP
jgi:single-stranded DNA-binding protein